MAIKMRRGTSSSFDPNKLVQGEFGLVTDAGKLYYCYSAGNVKQLQTREDISALLNASPTAYTALQQCVADLQNNPSQLTNILNNISALQSGKIDKTSIVDNLTTDDSSKALSAKQGKTLNDNLGVYKYHSTISLNYATSAAGTVPLVAGAMYQMFIKRPLNTPTDAAPGAYLISISTDRSMVSITTLAAANGTPTITLNADKTLTVAFSSAVYANCILYRVY